MISRAGKTLAIACTIAGAVAIGVAPSASAKNGNGVRAAAACSAGSTAQLKVRPDDGRLEVEFEVDQSLAGVPWNVQITRNGTIAFSGVRTTVAPSGSFSVERRIAGGASAVIRTTASRPGETCVAVVTARGLTATVPMPVPGVKLRGDGTVDDDQAQASPVTVPAPVAVATDDRPDNSGPGSAGDDRGGHGGGGGDHSGHGGGDN